MKLGQIIKLLAKHAELKATAPKWNKAEGLNALSAKQFEALFDAWKEERNEHEDAIKALEDTEV